MTSVDQVLELLKGCTHFSQVFGNIVGDGVKEQQAAARQAFARLALQVHPDHAEGDPAEAALAFNHLNEFYRAALYAIEEDLYDIEFPPGNPGSPPPKTTSSVFPLRSRASLYLATTKPHKCGNFSTIYRAKSDTLFGDVLIKIASKPVHNTLLQAEAALTSVLHNSSDPLGKYVSSPIDSFQAPGKNGTRFQAVVLPRDPGMVSLTDVISCYPTGLDPRDAAWVWRRVIALVMLAARNGIVHGSIVPDHVLVDPITHDPLYLGFLHSLKDPASSGKTVKHIINMWDWMYPPEVFEKRLPTEQTDVFMAGKLMVKLLGGDVWSNKLPNVVPLRVAAPILKCVEKMPAMRHRTGKDLMESFTSAIRDVWGKKYRPLDLPAQPD